MAATYDGSIRINTKIDQRGAQSGLKSLTSSLKGFALAVGAAFAVGAIINFGRSAIKLASDLAEVQNVIDTTFGGSVGLIEKFADTAAVNFGLSELAAKQYTGTMGAMLKSMGFAERAAADMSVEMAGLAGDMASFYNLSTDEAFMKIRSGISGETEPLKQLGVNLSVANLEAYALAQGMTTAYNSLDEQNKALLRYNYLLDVTSDAQGDFAKTSNSWANQIRILKLQWDSMKATLGGAFIQVLTPVIQMLNVLIGRLNTAAESFANFIAVITGNTQKFKSTSTEATDAVEGLADATSKSGEAAEKAGKKAGKGLASFDELNTLSSASGGGTGDSAVPDVATETATATEDIKDVTDTAIKKMEAKLLEFFWRYQDEIRRIKESWDGLKKTVTGFISDISTQFRRVDLGGAAFKALMNFVYAVIEAVDLLIGFIGKLFVALDVPAIVESALVFLSSLFKAIGDVVSAITPGILAFVDKALVPIAKWIGEKLRAVLEFFAGQLQKVGDWFTDHERQFTVILGFLGDIAAVIWSIIEPLLDSVWEDTKVMISTLIDIILGLIGVILDLAVYVIELPEKFAAVWEAIKAVWGSAAQWFSTNVLIPIQNGFKGAINNLISLAEGFVNGFIGGINSIIKALNNISFKNPITGAIYSLNIPTAKTVKLPRLAQGAVIPPNREFMAILGDQKRGVNIETPLETMIEAFKAALVEMGGAGAGAGDIKVYIEFKGQLARLGQVLEPVITAETQRKGPKFVTNGGIA